MSFRDPARVLLRYQYDLSNWLQWGVIAGIGVVCIAGYATLLAYSKRRDIRSSLDLEFNFCAALFPVVLAGAWLWCVTAPEQIWFSLLLLNLYVFALGVCVLVNGVRQDSLFNMNKGAALLALLFLFRFFDSDVDFVVRGIACILVGAGFLGMNLWVLRKRKSAQLDAVNTANNHN
jgi:hypothetical protein